MKRGEIWIASGGADYAGKPRPVVIIQDEIAGDTKSITFCPFTTNEQDAPLFRLFITASRGSGLRNDCRLMVDKITTVPKAKMGTRIGQLDTDDMLRLNRAVILFLGLANTPKQQRR
jgi:mRNA interferase MazF